MYFVVYTVFVFAQILEEGFSHKNRITLFVLGPKAIILILWKIKSVTLDSCEMKEGPKNQKRVSNLKSDKVLWLDNWIEYGYIYFFTASQLI